jgi:uncharacterized protein (DUF952 family)
MNAEPIYHVCRRDEWEEAQRAGVYRGSSQDRADGFIHFSSARQIAESVRKHRAGQDDLVILEVDPAGLAGLRWEPSRRGELFPHVHGVVPLAAVLRHSRLSPRPGGHHDLPWGLAG